MLYVGGLLFTHVHKTHDSPVNCWTERRLQSPLPRHWGTLLRSLLWAGQWPHVLRSAAPSLPTHEAKSQGAASPTVKDCVSKCTTSHLPGWKLVTTKHFGLNWFGNDQNVKITPTYCKKNVFLENSQNLPCDILPHIEQTSQLLSLWIIHKTNCEVE